jgi:hypothetical protein
MLQKLQWGNRQTCSHVAPWTHDFKEGLLEKPKLTHHAYPVRVIGSTGMKLGFWKLKSTSGTGNKGIGPYGGVNKPNQPIQSGYLPIWIPLISDEVTNSKRSLWHDRFFTSFIHLSLECSNFAPHMALAVGTYLVSFILYSFLYNRGVRDSVCRIDLYHSFTLHIFLLPLFDSAWCEVLI